MAERTISVVVPTWRRPQDFARCLAALAGQTRPPDEVVLVVREDDAASRRVADEARMQERIRLVSPPRPGLLPAVAAGFAAAAGDVVALTDDDGEPAPDWLARIEARFTPGVTAVGGRVLDVVPGAAPGAVSRIGHLGWAGHVIGEHTRPSELRGVRVDHLQGCNMAFLAPVPMPDERLRGAGHFFELGMSLEAGRRGAVVYDADIVVRHHLAERVAPAGAGPELRDSELPGSVAAASFNLAFLLARTTPGRLQRAARLAYLLLVGQRRVWGVARSAAQLALGPARGSAPRLLAVALRAKAQGWRLGSRAR